MSGKHRSWYLWYAIPQRQPIVLVLEAVRKPANSLHSEDEFEDEDDLRISAALPNRRCS
jgi:hypothetical protein